MSQHSDIPQVRRREPAAPKRISHSRIVHWAGAIGYSFCGVAATATPLVLWMSWSETSYYLTLLGGFVACCGIAVLSKYLPEYQEAERRENERRG
jgi:hypothetical protein